MPRSCCKRQTDASDVNTHDIMVLSLKCSSFEVKSSVLLRYQIECGMSYITALCCDSCDIFAVVAGSGVWLLKVHIETHTNEVVLHNSEDVDLLAAACMSNLVAVSDNKS